MFVTDIPQNSFYMAMEMRGPDLLLFGAWPLVLLFFLTLICASADVLGAIDAGAFVQSIVTAVG